MGTNRAAGDLEQPARVSLSASASIEEMASREGWTPDLYAVALAHQIRGDNGQPMGAQVERLQALATMGAGAASASAQELARHVAILGALFERNAILASRVQDPMSRRGAEAVERLTRTAIGCQKAATAVLGALHTLRQANTPTTPENAPEARKTARAAPAVDLGEPGADGRGAR